MQRKFLTVGHRTLAVTAAVCLLGLGACSVDGAEAEAGPDGPSEGGTSGSGESSSELAAMLPSDVRDDGVISWGVEPYYPPFTMSEDGGTDVIGINVDLAEELSALLGVEAEVLPGSFDGLIPGIQSERYDVGIATMADTEERREQVDFIDYFQSGSAIFVKPGNPLNIEGMNDLCGHSVGVVKGTFQVIDAETQAELCDTDGAGKLDVQVFNEQAGMLLALSSGRTEVMLMDYVAGSYAATTEGGEQFEMTGEIETPQRKGMIVSPERSELRDAVQAAMQARRERSVFGDPRGVGSGERRSRNDHDQ
ncbi:ABC transporter substrate-binding protein [Pseudactinotalea sp. HY158]|uniref:ABC transporter substrate-binding protein n=1 Tax=Pseudactinotalea sp. HY158 TaxID=2654547 RepID=UPI00129C45AF|nr:ABC transporter substrate-binding protein [Pseudactinotalea sp. HY158]QGH70716.1 transporter substrate-binding domain-containing protein [Pseudactinotalea sp. HY158]